MNELKILELDVLSCTTCGDFTEKVVKGEVRRTPVVKIPKGATRVTESSENPVPGHSLGEDIKYLWIGEAPGENEDKEGEPFVGVSGKYLKRRLIALLAKLPLEECRFTNIIKCHPLNNRNPYASEIKACWTWLEAEIDLVKPEVIFLLGAVATKAFLGVPLKQAHGQVFEWNGYPVMPLYHPAAVNRAVTRKVLEKDYKLIKERLAENLGENGLKRPSSSDYHLVSGLDELSSLIDLLGTVEEFALDIETDEDERSRKKGSPDPISNVSSGVAISVYNHKRIQSYFIPLESYPKSGIVPGDFGLTEWEDVRAIVWKLLSPHIFRCLVFIHNAKFEMESLDKYDVKFRNVFCTLLAAYTLGEETLGLKAITKRNFAVTMTDLDEVLDLKKQVVSDIPLSKVFPYACADSEYCYKYGSLARAELSGNLKKFYYDILLPLLPWIVEQELAGLEVDEDKREELAPYFKDKLNELQEEIYESSGYEFNLNSPEQVSNVLFNFLDLSDTKITESGFPSTDKRELAKVSHEHPVVSKIMQHGSFSSLVGTFINGLPKRIHPETGRLHPNVNQTGTATSRFSYSDPNMQNLPVRTEESKRLRELIVPLSVGEVIIAIDQSQIELRWAAHVSKDEKMIEIFLAGGNIHSETCKYIYEVDEDDKNWSTLYKNSKNGNFARFYDAEEYKISETLGCSLALARAFLKLHRELFPGYEVWNKEQKKLCRKLGYVEIWSGYRRYIPEIQSDNRVLRSRGERLAINTPIQGGAASMIQLAMYLIHQEIKRRRLTSTMLFQVHDELVFSVPEEEVKTLIEIAVRHLTTAVELVVPTPVEVQIGPSWGELESYEKWQDGSAVGRQLVTA